MADRITFKNLTVKLKDKTLYQNLNFSIAEGARYIFLGPNGVGKSLLLELIFLGNSNELADRYEGLSISGKILNENGEDLLNPGIRRKIAYAAQSEDFYRNSTIRSVCETACAGVGIEMDEDRLDTFLKEFGIYEKKNQKIKNNVSFGESKIVYIISRLLKLDATNILLLDEPLNHLSFKNSRVFNDLICREIEQNPQLTVIMVSHCKAMNFTNQAMVYVTAQKNIIVKPYQSYDCFLSNEYSESF